MKKTVANVSGESRDVQVQNGRWKLNDERFVAILSGSSRYKRAQATPMQYNAMLKESAKWIKENELQDQIQVWNYDPKRNYKNRARFYLKFLNIL